MAADPIHVEANDEVPAIIERIRRSPAEEVHLVVPPRARFGQSRFNFQLLKQYSTRLGKRVAIWSPDPMVQRLAEESGFGAFRPEPPVENGYPAGPAAPAQPVPPPRQPVPAPRPHPVPPPAGARDSLQARLRERAANLLPAGLASAAARPPVPAGLSRIKIGAPRRLPDRLARYPSARYVLYAGAGLLLLTGILAVLLYVPTATVTLVAQAQPFSTPVDVTATPSQGPVHVRLASAQATMSTPNIPATGNKVTPGQLATGQFTYVNGCPTALAIPNGQRLRSSVGVMFFQLGDVTVAQGQQQTIDIKATQSGQAGNVGAGQITGIDPNPYPCLTGTNQAPTAGGTDDQKQTVIQSSDIQSAKGVLESQVRQKILTDLNNGVQKDKGEVLAPPVFGPETFTTTHNVDDPSPNFTASLSLTAEGDYYVVEDLRQAVTRILASKVPRGEQLTTDKIDVTSLPPAASGNGRLDFNGAVTGYIAPKIDIERVKSQLAGRPAASAHDVLTGLPVKSSTISQSPPLPLLPLSASRIYVDYGVQAASPAASA